MRSWLGRVGDGLSKAQLKQSIAVGDWKDGRPIPSIRQLAVDVEISVITVSDFAIEMSGVAKRYRFFSPEGIR
jgi:DNA-binding transcriptional regulator YhcF (GntR family)